MNRSFFLISFILNTCTTAFLWAQQLLPSVIPTTGNSFQNNNVQLSYTVGETVINTLTTNNNTLTQGFQQPHYNITSIPQENIINTNFLIYPNPAKDELFILSPFEKTTSWTISLIDMNGKCLITNKIEVQSNNTITIPMHSFASGKYILTIYVKPIHQTFSFEIIKSTK